MTLYEVRAQGLYGGTSSWSFGYLFNSTALIDAVESAWDGAVSTFWNTTTNGYKNYTNADVTLVDTLTYVLNSSEVVLDKRVTANARVGINAHDSLSFNTAVWINHYGLSDTKSDRGGFYLPTPSNDTLVGEIWTSAFQTSVKAVLDPMFVTMRALAGYSAVKINKHTNKQGDPPGTQHAVSAWKMGNKPAAQRRRTKKRKPTVFVTGTI